MNEFQVYGTFLFCHCLNTILASFHKAISIAYMETENQTVISKIDKGFFDKCISVLGAVEIKKGDTLSSYIKNFKKSSRGESRIVNIYKERFQIPLFFGMIVFFVYYLLSFAGRGGKHEK